VSRIGAAKTGRIVEGEASMEDRPDVRVIAVPYDSGHRGLRMGAGPGHLLDNGLGEALSPEGPGLVVTTVRHLREPPAEVATAFELHGVVSYQVRRALADGEFPLVLSGNCNTAAIGTLAGAGVEGLGVVWLDAHGEFNTPETTTTGFLDGMGLAIAVGRCWNAMAEGVPGFAPVPEENVVMVGVRDADPKEQERLDASAIVVVGAGGIEKQGSEPLTAALDGLKTRVGRVYLHLDLDVLDAKKVGKANEFASEGGPSAEELQTALGMVRERFEVAAAGIASYDPAFDSDGRVLGAAIAAARTLTSLAGPPRLADGRNLL
jgi:arginase